MNLMKWMRKNKNKLMAVVVVLIMIAFTVPTLVSQWQRPGVKSSSAVAHYFNKKSTISNDDLLRAQMELNLLKAIGGDIFLQSRPSLMQTADIPSLAFSQTIFAETQMAPLVDQEIKRIARQQQLRLADWQIDEFFRQQSHEKPEILWLLLKAEARQAGYAVSTEDAGTILKQVIPQVYRARGASPEKTPTAEQVLASLMERQGVGQETILQAFADLLAVMEYSKVATQNEDITLNQLKYDTLRQEQTMDVNAVLFDAAALAKKTAEPDNASLQKQFDTYRTYTPYDANAANPYGFGYKQPPRVELEWMVVELSDVAKLVAIPTAEEAEDYYQKNQTQFTKQVLSDPNDPNSQKVSKLQSYAEVAGQIHKQILDGRISERADNIILAAKDAADANLVMANIENLTTEQMAKLAGDYKAAAEKAGQKFGVTVHVGKTGFVSASDLGENEILGRLVMTGQEKTPTPLVMIVFAIDELKASKLGPFAPAKPRMFESIGPFKDFMQQVVGLVRISGAQNTFDPCSLDLKYAKKLPIMKNGKFAESNDVYAVKDVVKTDVKKLEALPIAKKAADSLISAVPSQGWDKALAAVNKQYGAAAESNKPAEAFKLEPLANLRRISEQEVRMMHLRNLHDPVQSSYVKRYAQQKEFIDKLFSLLEPGQTVAKNVPMLVEFKPEMSYYVIKSMSRNNVDPNAFQQAKGRIALMQDYINGQSLGFEYFKADNIIKRTNFEWDKEAKGKPIRQELPPEEDVL